MCQMLEVHAAAAVDSTIRLGFNVFFLLRLFEARELALFQRAQVLEQISHRKRTQKATPLHTDNSVLAQHRTIFAAPNLIRPETAPLPAAVGAMLVKDRFNFTSAE